MGSSRKRSNKILGVITPSEAERLLLDLANVATGAASRDRMVSRYPQVFVNFSMQNHEAQVELAGTLLVLRDDLRQAWDAVDARHRDWYLFQLRSFFHNVNVRLQRPDDFREVLARAAAGDVRGTTEIAFDISAALNEPPPITQLEAALSYFQRTIADRAKHCANLDCPAPYFIAAKRWQKYCSEKCAGPANREAKRQWWHENKGKKS